MTSGLHAYDAGVFFILRRNGGKRWPPRDVAKVSGWQMTRMLAHQFDKPVAEVARDIIERALALEEGSHGNQRKHDRRTTGEAATDGDDGAARHSIAITAGTR